VVEDEQLRDCPAVTVRARAAADSDEFAASDRGSDSESESARAYSVARRAEAAMTPRHGISLAAGNLSGRRLGVSTGA